MVRKRYSPSRRASFSIPFRASVSAHLACRFLGREDERDVAAEDALEDRPDERVVRAAEDDGVDARLLERACVLAHGLGRLGREGVGALDQRHQPRAGDRKELDSRVERVDEGRVPACGNRRLGREQADPAVPRRLHRRVRLGCDHADDRHLQAFLELRKGRGGCGVAGRDDQLDALLLEVTADLAGKTPQLVERPRAVGEPRVVAEVDEVLVRHRDEALVQHGETAHSRVEHSDRAADPWPDRL